MNGIRAALLALAFLIPAGCSRSAPPIRKAPPAVAYQWQLPVGLPIPPVPADNPMSVAKVNLGRRLFHDVRLSGNGTMACATCHQQASAFTDGRSQAVGSTGARHARNTMSLTNVAYNASFGWADPTLRTLEEQMAVPMFNEHPIELGLRGNEAIVVARFAESAEDSALFREAFPDEAAPVTLGNIVKAIASFERTLVSGDSPLDRYLYRDDRSALPVEAVRGMKLYFSDRFRCSQCHATFNLSGPVNFQGAENVQLEFHNTGMYNLDGRGAYPDSDRGLVDRTNKPGDMGRFRAPTLRNVAVTAPYMHDGSVPTLEASLAHYASGFKRSPLLSEQVRGFRMTAVEQRELIAFLHALTDQTFLSNPAFGSPAARDTSPSVN